MKQLIPLDISIFESIKIAVSIFWIVDVCIIFLVTVIMPTYLLINVSRGYYHRLARQQSPALMDADERMLGLSMSAHKELPS